jgi:hypothetical protein
MLKLHHPVRALANLTQRQLAEAAGPSISTLMNFERFLRPVSAHLTTVIKRALETVGSNSPMAMSRV